LQYKAERSVLYPRGSESHWRRRFGAGFFSLLLDEAATAVEDRALLNDECPRQNISGNARAVAECDFITGVDVAFNCPIYSRDANIYRRPGNFRPGTHDERAALRFDLPAEVPVYAQRSFEGHFARELQDIADEAEPIIFGYICPADRFFTSRNCLTHHLPFFLVFFLLATFEFSGAEKNRRLIAL
jgi:hypothetical protein